MDDFTSYDEFGNYIPADNELEYELDQEEEVDPQARNLLSLMSDPTLVRNVALVGHLEHGKSKFMSNLVIKHGFGTQRSWPPLDYINHRWWGTLAARTKTVPVTLELKASDLKSYVCNIMDTPGHPDFSDEMSAALRLADGAVLIVDAADGVMVNTERAIRHAIQERLPIVLVINKIDRLILKLKLPPKKAYKRIRCLIDSVNTHITAASPNAQVMDPVIGNVCFASAHDDWSFTLQSFAKSKVKLPGLPSDAAWLWGDHYFDQNSSTIKEKKPSPGAVRSFVQLVLEPVYEVYKLNPRPGIVAEICKLETRMFEDFAGFTDMLAHHIPSAKAAAARKVDYIYTGPKDSDLYRAMESCDPSSRLMVNVTKLYPEGHEFYAFGRVYSGRIIKGQTVIVANDKAEDDTDWTFYKEVVTGLWIRDGNMLYPINEAPPGSWVLIGGVDKYIEKTATLVAEGEVDEDWSMFRSLQFNTLPVMKIAIEPLNPGELLLSWGLLYIRKTYPLAVIKIEKSGQCTVSGTGSRYMKCIEYDLNYAAMVEVQITDRFVSLCETVVESSSRYPENEVTVIAEPLRKGNAEDIESVVNLDWPRKKIWDFFQSGYDRDLLAARSIWAFVPDELGPNVLLDSTLSSEVDKNLLNAVKDSIVLGFRWGAQEGPLCNEPMRNVKFKIVHAEIAPEPLNRGTGQIIRTARRVAYSSFLMATPRIMEPVYYVEIKTSEDHVPAIHTVISRWRGYVTADVPQPGIVKAFLPVIESLRFESEMRARFPEAVFVAVFDHWAIVPGDPLDKSIVVPALEPGDPPAQHQHLAREFMVKTRRRKGMSEDV